MAAPSRPRGQGFLSQHGWLAIVACLLVAGIAILLGSGSSDPGRSPVADVPRSFFGVVPQGPLTEEDFARMNDGGVGTVRTLLGWVDVSPAPGDFDWEGIDAVVGAAARNGIELLPFLYGTPAWAAELDGNECFELECATSPPRSDEAIEAWAAFVGAAVERYGPEGEFWAENPDVPEQPVRTWQIWNEQNSPSFYQPAPDVAGYAKLLAAAGQAIHERDPEAQVVLGGMFGTPLNGDPPAFTAWEYLDRLYAIEGAADSFDGVGAHPYAAKLEKVESQVQLMREAIDRAGDDAAIWVTEIGWASGGEENPLNRGSDGQAEQLREAFELFIERREEWRIETVTWFSWRDFVGDSLCVWCAESGLFEQDELEPKPSWEAFTELTGGV